MEEATIEQIERFSEDEIDLLQSILLQNDAITEMNKMIVMVITEGEFTLPIIDTEINVSGSFDPSEFKYRVKNIEQ